METPNLCCRLAQARKTARDVFCRTRERMKNGTSVRLLFVSTAIMRPAIAYAGNLDDKSPEDVCCVSFTCTFYSTGPWDSPSELSVDPGGHSVILIQPNLTEDWLYSPHTKSRECVVENSCLFSAA